MGTTYQVPNLASYENHIHHHSAYASTVSHPNRTRSSIHDGLDPTSRNQSQPQNHPSLAPLSSGPSLPTATSLTSRQSAGPSTPTSSSTMAAQTRPEKGLSSRDQLMVLHSLHMPVCISPKGGSLADFAAQITCLFWCESSKVLELAETVQKLPSTATVRPLTENAVPCQNFKKWVQTVLSTTQVTQNVILLALLFIYRLKVANPNVRGRPGSEYRLLTVALMLGNKFLDDNTYTNKTWAEVSGISVGEIHVMEVEFLSNMRYSLLASKDEWEEWLVKLSKFREYCDRAAHPPSSPPTVSSPTPRPFASPLPSPTSNLRLTPASQAVGQPSNGLSPTMTSYVRENVIQNWPAISPITLKPDMHNFKKRNFAEEDPSEPPAKRLSRAPVSQVLAQQASVVQFQPSMQSLSNARVVASVAEVQPRLPVPNLSLNTNHAAPIAGSLAVPPTSFQPANYVPQQASALSLPPLVAGVRAMSTVYPSGVANSASHNLQVLTTTGPSISNANTTALTPTTTYPPVNYGTPTKRLSPQNALTPVAAYGASSPLSESFPQHALTPLGNPSGVHTPISHSPSIYLQQRPSPYKPVRHVNTLLYPPPSAFLQQYHISHTVPPSQMHYQPLGRRNEYRTGIVPEFSMVGTSGLGMLGGQHHAVTPTMVQTAHQMGPTPSQSRPPYGPGASRPGPSVYGPN